MPLSKSKGEFSVKSPKITEFLIGVSLFGFIIEGLCSGSWSVIPGQSLIECGGVFAPAILEGGQWWRLVTAMFLHGSPEHLALNMISLYIVGRIIELYFRPLDYLLIYFLSGIGGFLLSLFLHPQTVIIGASGAIFGIFGALGGFVLFRREQIGSRYREFLKEFGIILLLNLLFDLAVPGIDMSAHVGGLLFGGIGGYLAGGNRRFFSLYVSGMMFGIFFAAFLLQRHYPKICSSQYTICIDHRRYGRSKRMLNAPSGCACASLRHPYHRASTHLMHFLLHNLGLCVFPDTAFLSSNCFSYRLRV